MESVPFPELKVILAILYLNSKHLLLLLSLLLLLLEVFPDVFDFSLLHDLFSPPNSLLHDNFLFLVDFSELLQLLNLRIWVCSTLDQLLQTIYERLHDFIFKQYLHHLDDFQLVHIILDDLR